MHKDATFYDINTVITTLERLSVGDNDFFETLAGKMDMYDKTSDTGIWDESERHLSLAIPIRFASGMCSSGCLRSVISSKTCQRGEKYGYMFFKSNSNYHK
jgi:hypothetical protein